MVTVIQKLQPSDLEEATQIFKAIFEAEPWLDDWSDEERLEQYVQDLCAQKNSLSYGLYCDDRLSGIAFGSLRHWWEGLEYHIQEFGILPQMRHQGLGAEFLGKVEQEAHEEGAVFVILPTDSNMPSYEFYLRQGYQPMKHHVQVFKKLR